MIAVKVFPSKEMPKDTELNTTVSGGRVASREGFESKWDLSGVYPGTYTITVAATDGKGQWGEPVTVEKPAV